MGLAERRAVERFKNEHYPAWKTRMDEAIGFDVQVEVAWDELAVADYADSYAEFFPQVYFQPLVDALSAVGVDEMGRSAAQQGLSKIVIRNTEQYASDYGLGFADGVLTVDLKPHVNIGEGEQRAKSLQKIIEAGL